MRYEVDVVLSVEADSVDEAWEKAEALGKEEASYDDLSLRFNGFPARQEFAGVRKVIECQGPIGQLDDVPSHGAEVTYNKFNVSSQADLERLIRGDPVTVEYAE